MALPPLTGATWLTGWSLDLPPLLLSAALALGYLLLVRRSAAPWPVSRTLWFVGAGLGSLLLVTQSFLGTYERERFWPLAVQDVLLLTLVPLGLTLGRPVALWRGTLWRGALWRGALWRGALWRGARPDRRPPGRLVRLLSFPLVGSVAAVGTLLAIYTTGWDAARLDSPTLLLGTQVLLVALGLAFLWPLLGVDEGAGGTSYPVRAMIGFVDGLLDAIPGLAVLGTGHVIAAGHYRTTSLHDQQLGGTAMVALSELVGLPVLLVLLVQWVRSDSRQALAVDARLDQETGETQRPEATGRPWWETDPGPLGDRFDRDR